MPINKNNKQQLFADLLEKNDQTNFNQLLTEKKIGEQELAIRKNLKINEPINIQATIDLHSQTKNEAIINVENFIDNCQQKNLSKILIITGKGSGIIKQTTKQLLDQMRLNKKINRYKNAPANLGGQGAFIVILA